MNQKITTKVDDLMRFLSSKEGNEARIREISKELDIPEKRVFSWAKLLSNSDLIKKKYSFSGTALKFNPNY